MQKLAETINVVLSDIVNFDKYLSVCLHACVYMYQIPIPAACDQKSAQWNYNS